MDEFEFSFAFQPIVDAAERRIISFEALVWGVHGELAAEVFARVSPQDLYGFDQECRVEAMRRAARLQMGTLLNLNFLPNSVEGSRRYLAATLRAASGIGIPADRLVFEVTETGYLHHRASVERVFERNTALGFMTAIDDLNTGFAGFHRHSRFRPDYIKLDRAVIGDVDGIR
jgi:EAL domain-containing protein (putative c-di-GMP-specific phosphodiesterase class I)